MLFGKFRMGVAVPTVICIIGEWPNVVLTIYMCTFGVNELS